MAKTLTTKKRAFLDAYFGPANQNAVEAARLAGFAMPQKVAKRVTKSLFKEIRNREQELKAANQVSATELMEILATICRDPTSRDRIKAIELVAKIEGMLSEKIQISVDRREISKKLDEQRNLLLAAGIVEAEVTNKEED